MSFLEKSKAALKTRTAKAGSYSLAVTAIVLAILIVINLIFASLPSTWINYDISASRLYSVTSSTKAVVQNLTDDVTIYWITQSGEEDSVLDKLLAVYDSLSDKLTVEKKNPDIYPTFTAKYTSENVYNNSLIIECGERYRYISYADIYEVDTSSYYSGGSVAYSFDGEGLITTAIDYVVSDDLPQLYALTGHGEGTIDGEFLSSLERQNIEITEFSLLNVDSVPEEADAVIMYTPSSDISEEEADILTDYIDEGGNVIIISGPQTDTALENLHSVAGHYGVAFEEGIVIESDRNNYAFTSQFLLLPEIQESDITAELIENSSYILVPLAQGMKVNGSSSADVTSLLDTTVHSYSKLSGFDMETFEKEDGDINGAFSLAFDAETKNNGKLIYISSDDLLSEPYNSYSAGANMDFVMNCISSMIGEGESIAIRSKSLDYSYLTISESQASILKLVMLAAVPLAFVVLGIDELITRRKKA